MYRNCQVCGNPIFSVNDYGTDENGHLNRDYCSNCYKAGCFYAGDMQQGVSDDMPYVGLFAGRGGPGIYNNSGVGGPF